jgi:hypothetical protein
MWEVEVVAKLSLGRRDDALNEDLVFISDDFVGVIDGSTAKGPCEGTAPGLLAARAIYTVLSCLDRTVTKRTAVDRCSEAVRQVASEVEGAASASLILISLSARQIWAVGDGLLRVGQRTTHFCHLIERHAAEVRAAYIRVLIDGGWRPPAQLRQESDPGRNLIMPLLVNEHKARNIDKPGRWYWGGIDGRYVPDRHIREIQLPVSPTRVAIATDGYPRLGHDLTESEEFLRRTLRRDPLLIGRRPQTKGLYEGQLSFDDRSYVEVDV